MEVVKDLKKTDEMPKSSRVSTGICTLRSSLYAISECHDSSRQDEIELSESPQGRNKELETSRVDLEWGSSTEDILADALRKLERPPRVRIRE